jgi:hypothetical protein
MEVPTMKKASKKKSTAKNARKPARPASTADAQGQVSGGIVDKQPQVKDQAAVAREMFLYVDDAIYTSWSAKSSVDPVTRRGPLLRRNTRNPTVVRDIDELRSQ